jgi:SAM-dependent methyltransferase
LLALAARRRLGRAGAVIALDVSREALRTARRRADGGAPDAPLHFVVGTATCLPLVSESFDAVIIRAVLQFVAEKAVAARELFRVLRSGGRVSLFEPINGVARGNVWNPGLDVPPVQADHDRVVAYIHQRWAYRAPVLGFDERDLLRWFEAAGFRSVQVSCTYRYAAARLLAPADVEAHLEASGHTHAPNYAAAARAVLGAGAEAHLARMREVLVSRPQVSRWAETYLTAERQ